MKSHFPPKIKPGGKRVFKRLLRFVFKKKTIADKSYLYVCVVNTADLSADSVGKTDFPLFYLFLDHPF